MHGARDRSFFRWCGSISQNVHTGDIVVPDKAFIDEGTSRHYRADETIPAYPSDSLLGKTKSALSQANLSFHQGAVWSTDAIYRETRDKIRKYQDKQVLAVEMEVSALFTVAQFRNAELAAILAVSDELASLTWKPGFRNERFAQARQSVYETPPELSLTKKDLRNFKSRRS
ncbi:MAG: nucleoside phosphorylase [Desulfobacteraceae bacterium]|nr:nucleoside phosphorylase [Desulfobacteraceae bacterium]